MRPVPRAGKTAVTSYKSRRTNFVDAANHWMFPVAVEAALGDVNLILA